MFACVLDVAVAGMVSERRRVDASDDRSGIVLVYLVGEKQVVQGLTIPRFINCRETLERHLKQVLMKTCHSISQDVHCSPRCSVTTIRT